MNPKLTAHIHGGGNPIKLNDTITAGRSPVDQASDFMKDYLANNQNRYKNRSTLKGEGLLYVPPPPPPVPGMAQIARARSEVRPSPTASKLDIH